MNHCQNCREPIDQPATGRPRKWCSDRCRKAGTSATPITVETEPVTPAVVALLDQLRFEVNDPRAVAGLLLRQLATVLDADPGNVGVARELRQILTFLSVGASGAPGEVDEARLQFLLSRLGGS